MSMKSYKTCLNPDRNGQCLLCDAKAPASVGDEGIYR